MSVGFIPTRVSKAWGYWIDAEGKSKLSKKRIGGFVTVSFMDDSKCLKYALVDNLFLVGAHLVQRLRGHLIKCILPKPATLVGIGWAVNCCYVSIVFSNTYWVGNHIVERGTREATRQ